MLNEFASDPDRAFRREEERASGYRWVVHTECGQAVEWRSRSTEDGGGAPYCRRCKVFVTSTEFLSSRGPLAVMR